MIFRQYLWAHVNPVRIINNLFDKTGKTIYNKKDIIKSQFYVYF